MRPVRALSGLSVLLTCALPATAAPSYAAHQGASRRPATVRSIGLPRHADEAARAAGSSTRLAARRTTGFSMVGVTWRRGSGSGATRMQVRVHHRAGWSRWQDLGVEPEAAAGRSGTAPLWVGRANGVAVRVHSAGSLPDGLAVNLVDPGTTGTTARTGTTGAGGTVSARLSAARTAGTGLGSPTYTAQPAMVTRAQWGARRPNACDTPRYANHTGGVVLHHTAGNNTYTRAQSPSVVRGIQAYHMQAQGWCDIGYNFLVDRYGQIFVGRSGGTLPQVRGAHAGNWDVNTYAMGVSMIGDFSKAGLPEALKTSVVRLIGWRLGTNYLPAKGTWAVAGHRLSRISGHRDVYLSGIRPATSTECPGRYGYAWLTAAGGLRDQVAAYISRYSTPIKTKATAMGSAQTGLVSVGEFPTYGGHETRFTRGDMLFKSGLGAHWVYGAIRATYLANGAQGGSLGFPTSDVFVPAYDPSLRVQRFEHGRLTYDMDTRQTTRS